MQYGAVITFPEGTTREEARAIMRRLVAEGHIDRPPTRPASIPDAAYGRDGFPEDGVHGFNPEHGSPVFYIP